MKTSCVERGENGFQQNKRNGVLRRIEEDCLCRKTPEQRTFLGRVGE